MKGQLLRKIFFVCFLSPVYLFAQPASSVIKDVTGLWKGALYNDTTKKYLPFQIAISEENEKLSGYSYTLFDIDGKKELGIKKIRVKRRDDEITIEDIELISNNYSAPPPRGVKFHSVVNLSRNDTALLLTGKWNTNRTREYSPYNGTLQLERSADYNPEVLFKELVRLKLDQQLSFVRVEKKQQPDIALIEVPQAEFKSTAVALPQASDSGFSSEANIIIPSKMAAGVIEHKEMTTPVKQSISKPVTYTASITVIPAPKKLAERILMPDLSVVKARPAGELFIVPGGKRKSIISLSAKNREILVSAKDKRKEEYQLAYNKAKAIIDAQVAAASKMQVTVAKEPAKKPAEIIQQPAVNVKPKMVAAPVVINKVAPVVKEPVKTETKPVAVVALQPKKESLTTATNPATLNAAANVSEREMKNEQSVFYESDSLVLTLYDNGEVDGDTVSVLMNGQIIFARQGLSTKANSKTIYIDKSMPDSLSMIMYAENLGSIPPNTGLLIIMDGEKRYEVRFSADLKTNAAILLRRRKKEN